MKVISLYSVYYVLFLLIIQSTGWSFMHQAALCDKVRIVDLLIKSGLSVNAREFVSYYN